MSEVSTLVFGDILQEFVFIRTYSRWLDEEQRRETWGETVSRYCNYMKQAHGDKITDKEIKEVYNAIYGLEVMPSMRAMWSAGKAADSENLALYNCSFVAVENIKDFADILYVLLCGTGVGFSVERKFINSLPVIQPKNPQEPKELIVFEDSKIGWAKGFEKALNCMWNGIEFECDYSKIRPRGARLKTSGGRASGPAPLEGLINFTIEIIEQNRDYRLQAIDVHDICCKIADAVVVGGVRRSALLSLSDLTDNQMALAKTGEFWNTQPQRQMSNNSVAYTRKPDVISFMNEWKNLIKSKSGERGIFNRVAAQKKASENNRRDGSSILGVNPCAEILLRNRELCNLTEVIVRPDDTFDSLKRKIKIATMLGTWQAAFTNFKFVSKKWKQNCDEEALLGVSLSGLRDHKILGCANDVAKKWLGDLKHVAVATNKKVAERIGINRAAAITCIKPSGTVSVLVDCSPGAHVRQTSTGYYIRRVRISATDPLYLMLKDQGINMPCEVGQTPESASTFVLEFPSKAPDGARTRAGQTAEEQLEYWKMLREFYTEHNPSITISVMEDEWLDTAAWVYKHFDNIGGLSFLPTSDYVYQLAPYEDIDKDTYEKMVDSMKKIDFSKLNEYEKFDQTVGSKEFACSGGSCELR